MKPRLQTVQISMSNIYPDNSFASVHRSAIHMQTQWSNIQPWATYICVRYYPCNLNSLWHHIKFYPSLFHKMCSVIERWPVVLTCKTNSSINNAVQMAGLILHKMAAKSCIYFPYVTLILDEKWVILSQVLHEEVIKSLRERQMHLD